jgi:hypothetical protein
VETTLEAGRRQRRRGRLARASGCDDGLPRGRRAPETIRRACVRVGTAIRAAETAAIEQTQRMREATEPLDPAPGLMVLEADGANILFADSRHEVKLGMVAGWAGGQLVAPSYVAARESSAAFGPWLATEAARRGALKVDRWAVTVTRRGLAILRLALILADGAVWIWNLADEYVDQRVEISDFYQAAEHLAAVAAAYCPDPTTATAWLDACKGELLTLGPLPVLAAFDRLTPPSAQAGRGPSDGTRLLRQPRRPHGYQSLRLDGLPIGSGAIESAADHAVQRRMERAGMRWSRTGGHAMLALRARLRSRRPLPA